MVVSRCREAQHFAEQSSVKAENMNVRCAVFSSFYLRFLYRLHICSNSANKIVRSIFTCFGRVEPWNCVGDLGIADVYMPHMSSKALRSLVFDRFLCSRTIV